MVESFWTGRMVCSPCLREEMEEEWYVSTTTYRVAEGLCLDCGCEEAVVPSVSDSPVKVGGKYCVECATSPYRMDVDAEEVAQAVAVKEVEKAEEAYWDWFEAVDTAYADGYKVY